MRKKHLTKQQILNAQDKTLSNMSCARYLGVSYQHYKKYAKEYGIFESHKNQSGKGIPKFLSNKGKEPKLLDIIEGRLSASSFDAKKLKYRLIAEGYIKEECAVCGFCERRVLDYKVPLLMNFKDSNKNNYRLDNIEMLCYNHYFLQIGDVFNAKEETKIETPLKPHGVTERADFKLDSYHLERLDELGLNMGDDDELNDLIGRYE